VTDPRELDPRKLDVARTAPSRRRWEWLFVPALAGAASAVLSWERWIQPFVDGSREMQVPARLAAGERLYLDVAYYYGPAAPWVNAAAIELFGRRFGVLEAMGALAAAVLFVGLYRLARRAGSPLSAGIGVTIGAAICVGAPNGGAFLFPYAYAALFAAAGGFVCLAAAAGKASRVRTAIAALSLGCALLAKVEIGAAAAAALLVAALRGESARLERRRSGAVLFGAALLSAAGYAAAFRGMSLAVLSSEGPLVLLSPPPEWRQVYRLVSGLDDPPGSLARLATALFLDVLVLGAALFLSRATKSKGARPGALEAVWWALLAAGLAWCAMPAGGRIEDRLPPLLAPMPLAAAAAALLLLRSPLDARGRARFLLFAFTALVAGRVALNVAYGYVTTPYSILALPGLASSAAVLGLDLLAPAAARSEVFRRVTAAALLALAAAGLVRLDRIRRAHPRVAVETPVGTLRLPAAWAQATTLTLDFLEERARPGDTLASLPEAGMFNFVTGLSNPLRQEQILPGHLDQAAEARVAERIRASGPRFIVLVDQIPPGWAAARFGMDYARKIARAIESRYALAFAARSRGSPHALVRVLERRPG
jgi:hypothetical protein